MDYSKDTKSGHFLFLIPLCLLENILMCTKANIYDTGTKHTYLNTKMLMHGKSKYFNY